MWKSTAAFVAALTLSALCGAPTVAGDPVYKTRLGTAIGGYDPVAYFTEGRPVKGDPEFETEWRGATWRLSSAENLALFRENPETYAPAFGGYCAFAVAKGDLVKSDPEAWKIVDDRLYLNYSRKIQKDWEKDIPGYIARAEAQWPRLASSGTANHADSVADYARATYQDAMIATAGELVKFETVHREGIANADNPEFRAMTAYLREKAAELGLGFDDYGAVVVLSLGDLDERLGLATHGDVQPADPSKWAADPFSLDITSEPGRLVGRGIEDDKGPIAAALYAMKAVRDKGLVLSRRIELIVSYTEESDWTPFLAFLEKHPPPQLNVALDAEYPVVTAEKGWCAVHLTLAPDATEPAGDAPWLASFGGGSFLSQIPEDGRAVIRRPTTEVETTLTRAAETIDGVDFDFSRSGDLVVTARGLSAHSSTPWEGKNGITHLARVLGAVEWPDSQAARMVRLVNDLIGTGDYGTKFGDVAYEHPFMGRLTLSLTTLETTADGGLTAGINIRRPVGRTAERTDEAIREAVASWQESRGVEVAVATEIYDLHLIEDAAHIPVLLDIFRRHTGREASGPISIGGGTHARLLPEGVNFGPGMPGEPYTGHSEHEYMTRDQMVLNLGMYTAMLVELATAP